MSDIQPSMSSDTSVGMEESPASPATCMQESDASLMKRALALVSSQEACKRGLGCDPSLLLLLALPPIVLEEQIPVGRYLLSTLESLHLR